MSEAAPATAPRLGDVIHLAMRTWEPPPLWRSPYGTKGEFSGFGIWGDPWMQRFLQSQRTFDRGLSFDSAIERLFSTVIGDRVARVIGSAERALAALERLSLEALAETLKQTGEAKSVDRMIVVPRSHQSPPILLLMSPHVQDYRESQVITDRLSLPSDVLSRSMESVSDPRGDFPEAAALREVLLLGPEALAEVFIISQPEIVLTRRPRMIQLCVATPHLKLYSGETVSTAGLFCVDEAGTFGVTGCYHGTGPVGTNVMVELRKSHVKLASQVQDIVFIPLADGFNMPQLMGRRGVRKDREPARADRARFDGAVNNNQHTRIFGCDNGLLRARTSVQLKVQTDPDTDRGDSGCALIDESDHVLGFAFERTDYNDYPQFTDWIWAANALGALKLTPY